MNHYKQHEALLRAHEALVHDRAAHAGLPDDGRRLPPPAQRHGLRRAGRRQAGLDASSTARPGRCRSTGASSAPARTTTAARRTRRSSARRATARCSTRAPTTAPPTTRTTRSARSCTSRGRSPTARSRRAQGIPISAGEVLERTAVHDNSKLHVAAMGFWVLMLVRDDTVTALRAAADRPARGDQARRATTARRRTSTTARCRSCSSRPARGGRSAATAVPIGDQFFRPAMLTARVGQRITWRFAGVEPHSVTVANGPRGFSSNYLGNTSGSYSFTPTVPGTYRLTCLIHPTTMAQTAEGHRAALEEVQAEAVERLLGLDVELLELAGEEQQAHRDQDHAGDRGDRPGSGCAASANAVVMRVKATAVSRNGTARPAE